MVSTIVVIILLCLLQFNNNFLVELNFVMGSICWKLFHLKLSIINYSTLGVQIRRVDSNSGIIVFVNGRALPARGFVQLPNVLVKSKSKRPIRLRISAKFNE